MHPTPLLLLALAAFSSALPSTPARKDACTPKPYFTINKFTKFIPSSGNTNPASIYFQFSDPTDSSKHTECHQTGPSDHGIVVPCDNPNITALFDGSTSVLTIIESYTPCNSTANAVRLGEVDVSLFCIPSEPPMPNGYGEQCQVLPQGTFDGYWE